MRQLLRAKLFCSTSLVSNISGEAAPAIRAHIGHGAVWLGFLAAVALALNVAPAKAQTAPAGLPTDGVFTRGAGHDQPAFVQHDGHFAGQCPRDHRLGYLFDR